MSDRDFKTIVVVLLAAILLFEVIAWLSISTDLFALKLKVDAIYIFTEPRP